MIIRKELTDTIRILYNTLHTKKIDWVITGSFSFAIRGMETSIGDIDIQSDDYLVVNKTFKI